MIFYGAGAFDQLGMLKRIRQPSLGVLVSCYYLAQVKNRDPKDFYEQIVGTRPPFLDSGAYSLDNVKNPADYTIDDYLSFIKHLDPKVYVAYDVVGDPEQTLHNTMYMLERNTNPLPVIQLAEGMNAAQVCQPYIDAGLFKHIAVGNIVGMTTPNKECEAVWRVIRKHWPVKVHAFGNSNPRVLYRYPWYSFDSTSWLSPQRYRRAKVYNLTSKKITSYLFKNHAELQDLDRMDRTALHLIYQGIPRNFTDFTEAEFANIRLYLKRSLMQAYLMCEYAKELTQFWKQKGVNWNH